MIRIVREACPVLREQLEGERERHEAAAAAAAAGGGGGGGAPSRLLAMAWGVSRADRACAETALLSGELQVEVITLDSHRPDKYSRHLVLRPHLVLPPGLPPGGTPPFGQGTASAALRVPLPLRGSQGASPPASARTFASNPRASQAQLQRRRRFGRIGSHRLCCSLLVMLIVRAGCCLFNS